MRDHENCDTFGLLIGFLPTYGPSFIHFYESDSVRKDDSKKCLTAMPLYRGRLLLLLRTEMNRTAVYPKVKTIPAFPIIEVIGFIVMFQLRGLPRHLSTHENSFRFGKIVSLS
jgi:hypothetical protein